MKTGKMNLTIVLIALSVLSTTQIQAQKKTPPTPEERAHKLTEWMKTNLQLNDSQAVQVKDINLKYANKMQELYDNTTLTRRQKLQVLTDNDQAKDKELKNVFTEEQFKTYQSKKDEVKKQLKEKRKQNKNSG